MLCGYERGRYGNFWGELQKKFTKGNNYYPEYLMEAYILLLNYKTSNSKLVAILVDDSEEVLFGNVGGDKNSGVNKDGGVSGGRGKRKVLCYCCRTLDHIAR